MRLSERAKAQLDEFRTYYRGKGRPEAVRNVVLAMRQASLKIGMGQSLPAPRPYPDLRADGEAWVHAGHYWVLHTVGDDPVILAIFHDTADIPHRH